MQPPKNYSFKVYKVKLEELEKRENGKFTIIWVTLKYLSQKLTEQREKIIKDRVGLKKKKKLGLPDMYDALYLKMEKVTLLLLEYLPKVTDHVLDHKASHYI